MKYIEHQEFHIPFGEALAPKSGGDRLAWSSVGRR